MDIIRIRGCFDSVNVEETQTELAPLAAVSLYCNLMFDSESGVDVDYDFMKNKYNIKISNEEIAVWLAHKSAWRKSLELLSTACLIIEENVELICDFDTIVDSLSALPEDWDIYFPFDKLTSPGNKNHPYFLGFYWGSCVYFLSRKGAEKLNKVNCLRQPVDDEILQLTSENYLNTYSDNTNNFKIDFSSSFVHTGRKKQIQETVSSYNAWSQKGKLQIRKLLRKISDISKTTKVELILHGGSLLGFVQHNQIIPWDDDVDLGINEINLNIFIAAVKNDPDLKCIGKIEERSGVMFYKIWLEEGEPISNYTYKFPFVDLWLYKAEDVDIIFHNKIIFPNALIFAFEEIDFEGSLFSIPKNFIECLDSMYKEWKEKIVIYTWSHRLERVVGKPFKTNILTDEYGKFVDYKII